jgi:hypothetical protein
MFALQMCTLLLVSNIGQVIVVLSNYKISSPGYSSVWIPIQSLASLSRDGCFNFAYWLFAFTYLNSAISMPYIFKEIDIPEETERKKSLLFWGMAAINEIFIFIYCLIVFIDQIKLYKSEQNLSHSELYKYIALKYSVGFWQLVSAVFLIVAIVMIRKFLVTNGLG